MKKSRNELVVVHVTETRQAVWKGERERKGEEGNEIVEVEVEVI